MSENEDEKSVKRIQFWVQVLVGGAIAVGGAAFALSGYLGSKADAAQLEPIRADVAQIRQAQTAIEAAHAPQERRMMRIEDKVDRLDAKIDRLSERIR